MCKQLAWWLGVLSLISQTKILFEDAGKSCKREGKSHLKSQVQIQLVNRTGCLGGMFFFVLVVAVFAECMDSVHEEMDQLPKELPAAVKPPHLPQIVIWSSQPTCRRGEGWRRVCADLRPTSQTSSTGLSNSSVAIIHAWKKRDFIPFSVRFIFSWSLLRPVAVKSIWS